MPTEQDVKFSDFIRGLPAATEADLSRGNNMPLVRKDGPKRFPAEIISGNLNDLQNEINKIRPVVIEGGSFVNLADEEDIEEVENLLKLKNRSNGVGQLGYVILRADKPLNAQFSSQNTIYEIRYNHDLNGTSLTIPSNCFLYWNGGSFNNGIINCNYAESINKPNFGTSIFKNHLFVRDGVINVDYISNYDTALNNDSLNENSAYDLATAINNIVNKIEGLFPNIKILFSANKTYSFFRSIILHDNMTIDGCGCTIVFDKGVGENKKNNMFSFNSFLTNRKHTKIGENINNYTSVFYGKKNIEIKNIKFDFSEDDYEFWFNVNSERGVIAISDCDNFVVDNCSFNNVFRNTPIWFNDSRKVLIQNCFCKENDYYKNNLVAGSTGFVWTNCGKRNKKIDEISFVGNDVTCYVDECFNIFNENVEDTEDVKVKLINFEGNKVNSNWCLALKQAAGLSYEKNHVEKIIVKNNVFNIVENIGTSGLVLFESPFLVDYVEVSNNKYIGDVENFNVGFLTSTSDNVHIRKFVCENNESVVFNTRVYNSFFFRIEDALVKNNTLKTNEKICVCSFATNKSILTFESNKVFLFGSDNSFVFDAGQSNSEVNILNNNFIFEETGISFKLIEGYFRRVDVVAGNSFYGNSKSGNSVNITENANHAVANSIFGNVFVGVGFNFPRNNKNNVFNNVVMDSYYNVLNPRTATSTPQYKYYGLGEIFLNEDSSKVYFAGATKWLELSL